MAETFIFIFADILLTNNNLEYLERRITEKVRLVQ